MVGGFLVEANLGDFVLELRVSLVADVFTMLGEGHSRADSFALGQDNLSTSFVHCERLIVAKHLEYLKNS